METTKGEKYRRTGTGVKNVHKGTDKQARSEILTETAGAWAVYPTEEREVLYVIYV